MFGAIIGDIAGSRFEHGNFRSYDFTLFHEACSCTDDTVMTVAVSQALLLSKGMGVPFRGECIRQMQLYGSRYPRCGYGSSFRAWVLSTDPQPYNSWGNGAAMRVSPCAWAADSLEEALQLAKESAEVSHNHPQAIRGAQAVAACIYLARQGKTIRELREHVKANYYPLRFTLEEIRPTYSFTSSSQGSVPQAIMAFLESTSYEDAIRKAISIGGDTDTIAAIAGSIAEAYYGIPGELVAGAKPYLDPLLQESARRFEERFGARVV